MLHQMRERYQEWPTWVVVMGLSLLAIGFSFVWSSPPLIPSLLLLAVFAIAIASRSSGDEASGIINILLGGLGGGWVMKLLGLPGAVGLPLLLVIMTALAWVLYDCDDPKVEWEKFRPTGGA